jgi:hypothetical protein
MTMTSPRFTAALVALPVLLIAAGRASAGTPTVIFKVDGPSPDVANRLTDALVRAATARGLSPTRADATAQEAAQLLECSPSEASCLENMAATTDASAVIAASATTDSGKLSIQVTYLRRGQSPTTRSFELPEEPAAAATSLQAQVVDMLGGDQPAPPPRPAPSPKPDASLHAEHRGGGFSAGRVHALSWVVAASGAALLGASLAFKLEADGLESDVEEAPRMTAADLEALRALEDDGKQATTLSNAFFWTGAAALAAGAGLILWQGFDSSGAEEPALTLAPVPMAGGAGIALELQ